MAPKERPKLPKRNEGDLNPFIALWRAFFDAKIDFSPRVFDADANRSRTIDVPTLMKDISIALSKLTPDQAKEGALKLARASLDEVKELTEYQDQKATRLLTILAFLSALAGVLFGRLVDTAPPANLLHPPTDWPPLALVSLTMCYGLFGLFVLSLIAGALVTFKATQARFLYPSLIAKTSNGNVPAAKPRSRLFYQGMLSVSPADWARSFLNPINPAEINPSLDLEYLKNYIAEAYLIAAKVADKLRYLNPAQWWLQTAIRIILVWSLFFAATIVTVPERPQSSAVIQEGGSQVADDHSTGETVHAPHLTANRETQAPETAQPPPSQEAAQLRGTSQ